MLMEDQMEADGGGAAQKAVDRGITTKQSRLRGTDGRTVCNVSSERSEEVCEGAKGD